MSPFDTETVIKSHVYVRLHLHNSTTILNGNVILSLLFVCLSIEINIFIFPFLRFICTAHSTHSIGKMLQIREFSIIIVIVTVFTSTSFGKDALFKLKPRTTGE